MKIKEEKLLSRYIDNELGILGKFKAKSLLKRSSEARDVVEGLSEQSELVSSLSTNSLKVNLADKIFQRIEQEEKAEFYLGKRRNLEKQERDSAFSWGLVGTLASAAACLALFFTFANDNSDNIETQVAKVQKESFQAERQSSTVQLTSVSDSGFDFEDPSVEVEWLKSDGRVKMIPAKNEKQMPIIWIKPRRFGDTPRIIETPELNFPRAITVKNAN